MAQVEDVSKIQDIYKLFVGGRTYRKRGTLIEITHAPTPASVRTYEKIQKDISEQKDGENIVFIDILSGTKHVQSTSILDSLNADLRQEEISYFRWLARIWSFQQTIRKYLEEGKVVFVKNYTYSLACTGIALNTCNLEEMKESMAISWCNTTFRGLMVPDMTFILTESLSYIEEYHQTLLTADGTELSEIGIELEDPKNYQFHRSKMYVVEDTLQDFARLAPTAQMFPITNPALANSIIFTFGMKWQDVRHKKIKFY